MTNNNQKTKCVPFVLPEYLKEHEAGHQQMEEPNLTYYDQPGVEMESFKDFLPQARQNRLERRRQKSLNRRQKNTK